MNLYILTKHLHLTCVVLSISLFIFRTGIRWIPIQRLQSVKILKILPHVIDTVLLCSGLYLAYLLSFPYFIMVKLFAVFLYILFGFGVMKFAKNRRQALLYFTGSMTCLLFVLGCALCKTTDITLWPQIISGRFF